MKLKIQNFTVDLQNRYASLLLVQEPQVNQVGILQNMSFAIRLDDVGGETMNEIRSSVIKSAKEMLTEAVTSLDSAN